MIKLKDIILEMKGSLKVLLPRRDREERLQNYANSIPKLLQSYTNNGSEGDLDLSEAPIETLPRGFKVGGNLSLVDSNIDSLPDGLEVSGDLDLRNVSIKSLPLDLKVGGNLDLSGTILTEPRASRPIQYDLDDVHVTEELIKSIYKGIKGSVRFDSQCSAGGAYNDI